MKRIILLIILINTQFLCGQNVVLDSNGVTIKWTGSSVPNPYFVQANPRGTGMEWFAIVNYLTQQNITNYANNIQSGRAYFTPPGNSNPIPFDNIVTTLMDSMINLFKDNTTFNQPIGSWDVSNVTHTFGMFDGATNFNQPIGSWDVSNVNTMTLMFKGATNFNQPIGSWNVSNVTGMNDMFYGATNFNQPIGSWDVSNVTQMFNLFYGATNFNQPIGSWDVSNVTNLMNVFKDAATFNQPIGSWDVSNVTYMGSMFDGATNFNQPISSWNVSNVTVMSSMFKRATNFNQNIGLWNVSNVTYMGSMLYQAGLSTANYDALLIGWSTISPNETPLRQNVTFSAVGSKYCNGSTARSSIISDYGWTITDSGLDCSTLGTDEFDASILNLFPNPVSHELNVKTDYILNNQPYAIIDSLGRVVLNGKLNNIDTIINVEQLTKGIYYLKIAGKSAIIFIKD